MAKFIRFKMKGAEVLEIDLEHITTYQVRHVEHEEGPHTHDYELIVYTTTAMYCLAAGTFDKCHFSLNQIHQALNLHFIDI